MPGPSWGPTHRERACRALIRPSGTTPSAAQRTARLLVLGFELADHGLSLVVEGGDDLVGVLFRVVKSQAADREIDDFMTVPRSRPG